jgi:hypothetical protein
MWMSTPFGFPKKIRLDDERSLIFDLIPRHRISGPQTKVSL